MHWYEADSVTMIMILKDVTPKHKKKKNPFYFSPAYQDQERRTPLHAAACVGDVHIMDLLIESGE